MDGVAISRSREKVVHVCTHAPALVVDSGVQASKGEKAVCEIKWCGVAKWSTGANLELDEYENENGNENEMRKSWSRVEPKIEKHIRALRCSVFLLSVLTTVPSAMRRLQMMD